MTTNKHKTYSDWLVSLDRENLLDETIDMIVFSANDSDLSIELKWKRDACRTEWVRRDDNDQQYIYAQEQAVLRMDENEDQDQKEKENRDEGED